MGQWCGLLQAGDIKDFSSRPGVDNYVGVTKNPCAAIIQRDLDGLRPRLTFSFLKGLGCWL